MVRIPPKDWQLREQLEAKQAYAESPEEQAVWHSLLAVWDVIHFLRPEPIDNPNPENKPMT